LNPCCQFKKSADKVRNFKLLLTWKYLRKGYDVVKDGLAYSTTFFLDYTENVGDLFEQKSRSVAFRVVVDLNDFLDQG
jgi:hypothetical protein